MLSKSIISKKRSAEFCLSLTLVRERRVEFEESLTEVSVSLVKKVEFCLILTEVRKVVSNLKKV